MTICAFFENDDIYFEFSFSFFLLKFWGFKLNWLEPMLESIMSFEAKSLLVVTPSILLLLFADTDSSPVFEKA